MKNPIGIYDKQSCIIRINTQMQTGFLLSVIPLEMIETLIRRLDQGRTAPVMEPVKKTHKRILGQLTTATCAGAGATGTCAGTGTRVTTAAAVTG